MGNAGNGMGLSCELSTFEKTTQTSYLRRAADKLSSMWKLPRGFTINSGAAEHVIPLGWVNCVQRQESAGSKKGVHYVAATGEIIPNMGQQRVPFWTTDGVGTSWLFQVARINKPLVSVTKLNLEGWKVVFDLDDSYLQHKKTGKVIALRRERGVFVVDAYLEKDPQSKPEQVFRRQGS